MNRFSHLGFKAALPKFNRLEHPGGYSDLKGEVLLGHAHHMPDPVERVDFFGKPDAEPSFHLTHIHTVCTIVNMSQNLNAPQSKFFPLDLVNIFKVPATAAPQPVPNITFPMPSVSLPSPAMLQKLKHGWLKRLTSRDLLDVPREVLIEALCEKGAVLTTQEMARLGK